MDVIVTNSSDLQKIVDASVEAATTKVIARMEPAQTQPKEWLTNREAMAFLGLSKTTLQRYRVSGLIPFSKIGGNIFYKYDDLVAVLEANKIDR